MNNSMAIVTNTAAYPVNSTSLPAKPIRNPRGRGKNGDACALIFIMIMVLWSVTFIWITATSPGGSINLC